MAGSVASGVTPVDGPLKAGLPQPPRSVMFSGQGGAGDSPRGSPRERRPGPHLPAGPSRHAGPPGFLAWFPWEKILIWGLFLTAVYVLRHFFFIIFMTFMITYMMGNVVKRITW